MSNPLPSFASSARRSAGLTIAAVAVARSARLWQPHELPRVHNIDLAMEPADFQWQIDNQDMQYENARDMDVTANFDGETFPGCKFKVHGGKYQRGGGQWGPGHAQQGGDCYRRGDRSWLPPRRRRRRPVGTGVGVFARGEAKHFTL